MSFPIRKTSDGKIIEFEFCEECLQNTFQKEWNSHKLTSYVDGVDVGYLKVSYIPEDKFKKFYPSIWYYLPKVGYHTEISLEKKDREIMINSVGRIFDRNYKPIQNLSKKESEKLFKFYTRELKKRFGKRFDFFKFFCVNKPIIDFIEVKHPYRRKRIGSALYEIGSRWMGTKNLRLYSSTIQSDDAVEIWKKLKTFLPVKTEYYRDLLDIDRERMFIEY